MHTDTQTHTRAIEREREKIVTPLYCYNAWHSVGGRRREKKKVELSLDSFTWSRMAILQYGPLYTQKHPVHHIFTLIRWVSTSYSTTNRPKISFPYAFYFRSSSRHHIQCALCILLNDGHGIVFADVRAIYHEKLMNKKVKDNVTPFVITSDTVKLSIDKSFNGRRPKKGISKVT